MTDRRPTPEEMLQRAAEEAARERRGRLKVFFGFAPGVGKTYAMLEGARARRAEGADVVIGWVETHGRAETARLAQGIERLPPRVVEHRGISLQDFDLDAALGRRPKVLVLDELAHTNAPSQRHTRRWQDVEELLDAGVDVYTTLNVQHLESVNDLVAQIAGITVRETVPDAVLQHADEIELVDLPPDDLLQRLREGKVYVPEQAQRAIERFFQKGNLIALRELALRRTAERVDAQAVAYKREHGITGPWRTGERILVAIGPAPQSANLIRAGLRIAAGLRAPWIALWVETSADLSRADRDRVTAHLELAERLGAEPLVVRGERVSEEVLAVARERNVSRVLVGKPTHPRWRDRLYGSLVDQLVRGSRGIDVLVTTGEAPGEGPAAPPFAGRSPPAREYGLAAGAVGLATVVGVALRGLVTTTDQAMLFLLTILLVATRVSRRPAILASFLGVASFDFFFVPPYHTFVVSDLRYWGTFALMFVVGLVVSTMTVRIREQAEAARERERRTAGLYAMSREFAVATAQDEIARTAARHLTALAGGTATMLLPDGGTLRVAGGGPPLAERELAVARWVFDHARPAGRGTDTLPASEGLYLPLVGQTGKLGVVGLVPGWREAPEPSRVQLLESYVAQAAVALERAQLAARAAGALVAAETERTRSAILGAISHDIRTPLASIAGSAGALLQQEGTLDAAARRQLLETIWEEAESLARLIGDLLDLSRFESGGPLARKEPVPVEEVIASAVSRMERRLDGREVATELPREMLLAPMDPVLIEQVLAELIENACRYSPSGSPIGIVARAEPDGVAIEVADRGPGLPPGDEERVFERFYRGETGRGTKGTGLGLAVCRAIVGAHGGTIAAANRPGGGAVFRFTLPNEPVARAA